jgi:hypothetical protein
MSWAVAGEHKKQKKVASRHAARRAWAFMLMLMLVMGVMCAVARGCGIEAAGVPVVMR